MNKTGVLEKTKKDKTTKYKSSLEPKDLYGLFKQLRIGEEKLDKAISVSKDFWNHSENHFN